MEKRALLAISLSIAVMVLWQFFFAPPPPEPGGSLPEPAVSAERSPGTEPAQAAEPADRGGPAAPGVEADSGAPSEPIEAPALEEFRVVTGDHDVRFTNEGGRILWWRLPAYMEDEDVPVDLVPDRAASVGYLPLQMEIKTDAELSAKLTSAKYVRQVREIPRDERFGIGPGKRVTFTYDDGRGLHVVKSLDLPERGFVTRLAASVTLDGRPLPASVIWAAGLGRTSEEAARRRWQVNGRAVFDVGGSVKRLDPGKVPETGREFRAGVPGGLVWCGLESTYFVSLVLPAEDDASPVAAPQVILKPRREASGAEDEKKPPLLTASLRLNGQTTQRLYVGPKDYEILSHLGHDLDRVIDFSRISLIYAITKYLFLGLTWINGYIGNYGWSIITLTVLLRVVFFPLTYRSMITMRKSSKKMAKVQPKVKAIQERYRKMKRTMDARKKMNDEIMALYKREGVNPMSNISGCLPMLLQMPIFIAFYNLLAVTIEVRHAPFIGWIHDLSQRDPYYITPLLMGASWLLQQSMTSSSIPDPTQRRMMMFMPVMFTFFMMNMPSGLVVYWLTSNLLGMVQQYLINKKADAVTAPSGRSNSPGKPRRADGRQTA